MSLTACGDHRPLPAPTASTAVTSTAPTSSAPEAEDAGTAALAPPVWTWLEAVRLERWAQAATLIDALPEEARAAPEMRYVRARVALAASDPQRALELLEGLENQLPLLKVDIARFRKEAEVAGGPLAQAAATLARSTRSSDLGRAAVAYEKLGNMRAAESAAERAVQAAVRAHNTRDEVSARLVRADIARAHGREAAALTDLRWVVGHSKGSPAAITAAMAIDRIKRLAPPPPVTSGPPSREPAPSAPPSEPAPAPSRALARGLARHNRAHALYKARDFEAAARAFREAAAAQSGREAEDLFYAGRAFTRADHDDDALAAFREAITRFPRSPFAQKSAYYAARVDFQRGHFDEASAGYAEYLSAHPSGEFRDDAEYERAISLLSSNRAEEAQKALLALARKAPRDKAARLRELEALASARAGNRDTAVAVWTEIAQNEPLTWAAIASRARLKTLGAPVPPLGHLSQNDDAGSGGDFALPPAPALLTAIGLDQDAESYLVGNESAATASYRGREAEALCSLYGQLTRARRRFQVGMHALDSGLTSLVPVNGNRWVWDCIYPRPYAFGVRALELQHGIPRGLVHAVMRQESSFDPNALSSASAVGLMQLIPPTAKQVATELSLPFDTVDLTRPDENLSLGAFYLGKLLRMFQGHPVLATAAYNAGPKAVSRWVEASSDHEADLWVARIPYDETRTYVMRVLQNHARYQWLMGGETAVSPLVLALPRDARAPADAY